MLANIDTHTYNDNLMVEVGKHLQNMTKVLRATRLKLDLSAPRDVQEGSQYKAATLLTLDQLEINLDDMEMVLDEMTPVANGKNLVTALLVATSLVGVCLGAFITYKLAR